MLQITRREKIKEILLEQKIVQVAELSALLSVSEETIRRDLAELEKEGFAEKKHGGAVLANRVQSYVDNNVLKNIFKKNKAIIASRARTLINEGDCIYLDSSTTSLQIAEAISDMHLIVVTNSIDIANYLSQYDNIRLTLIGGNFYPQNRCFVGRQAIRTLKDFNFDKSFISCRSIDMKVGCTDVSDAIVDIHSLVLTQSKMKVIVADHSKFNKISFISLFDLERIDCIVTDQELSEEWRSFCVEKGIRYLDHDEDID